MAPQRNDRAGPETDGRMVSYLPARARRASRKLSATHTWHIVTGEYPPDPGGVSDYTRLVALGLAARGDGVHVWAPAGADDGAQAEGGVEVHRLPGGFGPRTLDALSRGLAGAGAGQILVQYVPQGFGMRGMNLPFCV